MSTEVVNINRDEYDVYIGRGSRRHGLPRSPFCNPFIIGKDGDRDEVIRLFRKNLMLRLRKDLKFKRKFLRLKGKRLGGHCAPEPCHGDVIKAVLEVMVP